MNDSKFQAGEVDWMAHPGVQRRVSVVAREGLPADTPAGVQQAANLIDYYQRRGRRLQAVAVAKALRAAGRRLACGTRAVLADLRSWREVRIAERELARLDDRLLKDIGISRSDIPAVVRGTLEGRFGRVGPVSDLSLSPPGAQVKEACNDAQARDAA